MKEFRHVLPFFETTPKVVPTPEGILVSGFCLPDGQPKECWNGVGIKNRLIDQILFPKKSLIVSGSPKTDVKEILTSKPAPGRLILIPCLFLAMAMSCALYANTVAYYRFEEGTNGLAASGTNTILDCSGNGLNGTPYGSVIYTSNVPVNPIPLTDATNLLSLSFDGFSGRIFIPDYPQLALTNSITLEAFIYATSPGTGPFTASQIIFRGDDRSSLDPYTLTVVVRNGTTNLQFQITDQNNNTAAVQWPITLNSWHHVAGALNGTNGVMSLYIDGNLATQTITSIRPYGVLTGANPGIGIGNVESTNYDEYYQGFIDEVRISDAALVPSQFLNATPILTIVLSGTNIVLTWPTNFIGFTLQSTTNLSPATWSTVLPVPIVVGGQNAVTNFISGPQQFFRLFR